jgi:hypothetical protein
VSCLRAAGRKAVRACIEAFLEQHDKEAPTATVPPGTSAATATALTMPSVPDSRAINLLFRPLTTRETAFVADGEPNPQKESESLPPSNLVLV